MLKTYYRTLIHDREGKLIKDSGLIPSRSYVIQFLEMIEGFFSATDKDATDTSNAESPFYVEAYDASWFSVAGAAGVDTHGIVVGTNAGSTPEGNENYKLDTKILHSATEEANKLNYQAVTFVAPTVDGANVDFDITRTFLNESGGTITVKEIGIIVYAEPLTPGYFLLLRDVVSDEAVLDDYTLTVVYTLRTTV